MERGNSKHGPRLDDQMEREVEALLHGPPGGGRTEEWHDPEAPGEDQPEAATFPEPGQDRPGGTPEGIDVQETEQRARFAGYLARSVFPADPTTLRAAARAAHAPDDVLALLDRLPEAEYLNVSEVWQAVGGGMESRRW
jgi:Protein of unknown function (DUF2795)